MALRGWRSLFYKGIWKSLMHCSRDLHVLGKLLLLLPEHPLLLLLSLHDSEVLHDAPAVKLILLRLDPETPVYESKKLRL